MLAWGLRYHVWGMVKVAGDSVALLAATLLGLDNGISQKPRMQCTICREPCRTR